MPDVPKSWQVQTTDQRLQPVQLISVQRVCTADRMVADYADRDREEFGQATLLLQGAAARANERKA